MRSVMMLFVVAFAWLQVLVAGNTNPRCGPSDNQDDCKALVDLYDATNGVDWKQGAYPGVGSWGGGEPICDSWYGVMCDSKTNRVADVDLDNNNLIGSIPESISKLTALSYSLSLQSNQLTGTIPKSIGQLKGLPKLLLRNNRLTGSIPDSISQCSALEVLDLYHNYINGTIPVSLGQVTTLTELNLGGNKLTGAIPDSFNQLKALAYVDLASNQFTSWPGHGFCNRTFPLGSGCTLNDNNFICPLQGVQACAATCKAACTAPEPTPSPPVGSKSNTPIIIIISGICGVAIIGGYMFITRRWRQQQQADTEEGLLSNAIAEPGQEAAPTAAGAESHPLSEELTVLNAQEGLGNNLLDDGV